MNDAPTTQAKRVAFYVDGYNLYHSINNIVKNNPGRQILWVDVNCPIATQRKTLGEEQPLA